MTSGNHAGGLACSSGAATVPAGGCRRYAVWVVAAWLLGALEGVSLSAAAQSNKSRDEPAAEVVTTEVSPAKPAWKGETPSPQASIQRGVELLVQMQEGGDGKGDARAEWPYEGVYRVQRKIPVGYRIGGTSICAIALLRAPGYEANAEAQQAVARAAAFVVKGLDDPLMNPDYSGGYDVRGWGYTYCLQFMLVLLEDGAKNMPEGFGVAAKGATERCIKAIQDTEIAKVGGWNYARGEGKETVSPPSPFMTGPTLQALFEAKRQGFAVSAETVDRALTALELGRTKSGSVTYAGVDGAKSREPVPGSVGRMLVSETTLYLAGRSSLDRVRGSVDAFFVHWEWLEKRRRQQGTHVPPYGIAPYYFFYAHYYAAQAIELLPSRDREEYRRKLAALLFKVREEDGSWNDRAFDRSANYGTAMAMMALGMGTQPRPAGWGAPAATPPGSGVSDPAAEK